MIEEIIELKGENSGPTSIILVGVHGNERCGVEALEQILPSLKIDNGVVFIAYGNPEAIKRNERIFEANLNRMFKPDEALSDKEKKSYEYSRAQFLKKYLNQADALLDVHASFTPESRRFIICEPNSQNITKYLPFDLIVSGFDAIEPGGTDYYMNSIGKMGVCVECGYLGDSVSTQVASESIYSFLKASGNIKSGELKANEQTTIQMTSLYLSKTNNFRLLKQLKDFAELNAGEAIALDGEEEIRAEKDGVILFANDVNEIGAEAYLFGEYKKGPTQ